MDQSVFNPDFQNQDKTSKIVAALERLSEAFRVALWNESKKTGLSPIQIQLLLFIKYHPSKLNKVTYLAQEFNMTKPTISDAIKVLEKKGYVNRIKEPHDTRSHTIHLTESGNLLTHSLYQFADPIKESFANLDEQVLNQMLSGLFQAIEQMNKSGFIHTQRMCMTCRYFQKNGDSMYCKLLESKLFQESLRIDCPEHESVS